MRDMKDSGLDWITEIPKDWKVDRLKYKFSFGKGLPITKDNLEDEGIAVISYGQVHSKVNTGTNIDDELIRYVNERYLRTNAQSLVHKNDFIFADTSEDLTGCGNCVYVDKEMQLFAGYHTIILRALNEDTKYFSYLFLTDEWRKQLREKVSGVKLFSVTQKIIKEADIIIPPISEQKKITAYLDKKCDEISLLCNDIQSQISSLEEYKRSIITEAVTKGLNADVEMKDSGIEWCPVIPKHWHVVNPKSMFSLRTERARKGERQLTASQKLGIVYQDEFMQSEGQKVVTVEKDFNILKHVEPNDFVISMRSFQGGLEYSELSGSISSAYVMLIPNKDRVYPAFWRWFFKSSKYINAIQSTTNLVRDGQAMRYANFVKVPLFTIPLEEQKEIADYLNNKCKEIDEILTLKKDQLATLEQYKKSLIYEYVTGKKEVPNE